MRAKAKHGAVLAGGGAVLMWGGSAIRETALMWVGVGPFMVGCLLLWLAYRKWYCAQCGQFLGRGDRPNRCARCGSNRVTNEDPGVGDKVRVERK